MIAVLYSRVERRNFGDLLSADGFSRLQLAYSENFEGLPFPAENTVLAIWSRDAREMAQPPSWVVCQDGGESDWAAWITTFAAKIRPFSAHTRLVSFSEFGRVIEPLRSSELGSLIWPLSGVVLGEVMAALRLPDRALDTVSAASCVSSLSFAMFRTAYMYRGFEEWAKLISAWETVRQITKQRPRPIESSSVARVCAAIMLATGVRGLENVALGRGDMRIREACHELINSPERPPMSLFRSPEFSTAERQMHGPRENRVLAFEEFVHRIDHRSSEDSDVISFMLGYLASRIAPGTIRHTSVLNQIGNRFPAATLWYGFCAGFGEAELSSPNLRPGRVDFPASARRVTREILREEPVLGPPFCDIGFVELSALARTGGEPLDGLITTTQSAALIELYPRICTAVNISSKSQGEGPDWTPRERNILVSMGRQLDRLREIYDDLMADEGLEEKGNQPSLFQSRRRKK
jgi:hypothetical protein